MDAPNGPPTLRIGELSRRLGVSDHVLRAWERRYGLLQPVRSPGGFRLYSEADEMRIRRMQTHLAHGLSAAEAEHWVETHDRDRRRFVKEYLHVDADDPLGYDMVLNSKRLHIEECAEVIVQAARAREARLAGKTAAK